MLAYYITSASNNLDGEYEFLKALGLLEDEVKIDVDNADDEESVTDDDDESCDDDAEADDDDDWWDSRKSYTWWDYISHFGEDAWDKLYQARLARHRNILLRLFTRRLPNLSEHERNGLFGAFSRSREFGIDEHNSLLDALAHPKEGLNLSKYDELGLY